MLTAYFPEIVALADALNLSLVRDGHGTETWYLTNDHRAGRILSHLPPPQVKLRSKEPLIDCFVKKLMPWRAKAIEESAHHAFTLAIMCNQLRMAEAQEQRQIALNTPRSMIIMPSEDETCARQVATIAATYLKTKSLTDSAKQDALNDLAALDHRNLRTEDDSEYSRGALC